MKISQPDKKKIYFLGLLLYILIVLTYFDSFVFVDKLETRNSEFDGKGITLRSKMVRPKSENKGMTPPPTSSQQAPTKNTGPKPQMSGVGNDSTSVSATSSIIPNARQTFNANQSYGVQNTSGSTVNTHPSHSSMHHTINTMEMSRLLRLLHLLQ